VGHFFSLNNASRYNTIYANRIGKNRRYGIIVDGFFILRPRSGGNWLFLNDLYENRAGNARDMSDTRYSKATLLKRLRQTMPSLRMSDEKMLQTFTRNLKPAINRWNGDKYGNRYDNFDEKKEGFEDVDGNGIGEVPYRIPGGGNIDHFPLTQSRIDTLLSATQVQ